MDNRSEVRDFLTTRRGRVTPEQVGLSPYGGNRRVSGLRREEVAMLAGVSVDYYTRLERGNLSGVSEGVLEALARALRLGEAERDHLFDLARAAGRSGVAGQGSARARRRRPLTVRPQVQQLLDAMTMAPAYVRDSRLDILATNALGRVVFAPLLEAPASRAAQGGRPVPGSLPNLARFMFLDPAARDFYVDRERLARDTVAIVRTESGRDPHDPALAELVEELCARSEEFHAWWAAHDVRLHRTGVKRFQHPEVGELALGFESMELTADPGLRMIAYSAEPASSSADALALLATLAAPQRDPRR